MADQSMLTAPDATMLDDDTQIPPIDNIHNIPSDPPAPPPFGSIPPPIHPSSLNLPENTQIPPSEPFNSNAMPAATRSTANRAVNGTPEVSAQLPAKAAPHGAPVRRYLNEKVVGSLLEGMKRLANEQPDDPLRVLGEFLIQKSKELEGVKGDAPEGNTT